MAQHHGVVGPCSLFGRVVHACCCPPVPANYTLRARLPPQTTLASYADKARLSLPVPQLCPLQMCQQLLNGHAVQLPHLLRRQAMLPVWCLVPQLVQHPATSFEKKHQGRRDNKSLSRTAAAITRALTDLFCACCAASLLANVPILLRA